MSVYAAGEERELARIVIADTGLLGTFVTPRAGLAMRSMLRLAEAFPSRLVGIFALPERGEIPRAMH